MILFTPKHFDSNELFVIASIILVLTISVFLPLRFSPSKVVYILMFNFFLAVVVDQILAVPPYDLYDIMDNPQLGNYDVIIYLILYPATVYIYMTLVKSIGLHRRVAIAFLLIGYSSLMLLIEWFASQLGVYKYHGWTYYLSGISYLIIFSLNLLVLYYITSVKKQASSH